MSEATETDILPLDGWHRARGARMVAFAGYAMPIQYEGIIAEHLWTRSSAGLFDVSHMGQLLLTGADADSALERLLPGDIVGLKPGRIRYSLLLTESGGIVDDLMMTRLPEGALGGADFYMVVNGATKHGDIDRMRAHLLDGIAVEYQADWALLALQGPKAADALSRIVPGVDTLMFMQAGGFAFGNVSLWISRSGYTGEDGYEISVPAAQVEALASALLDQPEVKPIGLGARDSLRLEAGLPLYGHDLTIENDPVSAGLGFALPKRRRANGGFPGAEKIIGYLAGGAPTRRVGLLIEGRLPAREGAAIYDDAVHVGTVTSGGFAPSVNAPIAMGYVAADRALPGTPLEIEVRGKRLAARVVPMPFVPHRYVRQGAPEMILFFTDQHEWIAVEGDSGTIGVTDYAQAQLGDVVFVEAPPAGTIVTKGKEAAVVESVKAASDVYSPVSGTVTEPNAALEADPALVNTAPETDGWFFRLTLADPAELDGLMDEAAYKAFVAGL